MEINRNIGSSKLNSPLSFFLFSLLSSFPFPFSFSLFFFCIRAPPAPKICRSVWSLSVFSLGIFRPFLGLFHGFLSSMMSIFARLLLWWKRWSIYLRGKINNQHSPSLDIWLMKRFPDASITVGGCCTSRLAILCAFVRCFPSRSSHAACCSGLVSSIMFM